MISLPESLTDRQRQAVARETMKLEMFLIQYCAQSGRALDDMFTTRDRDMLLLGWLACVGCGNS